MLRCGCWRVVARVSGYVGIGACARVCVCMCVCVCVCVERLVGM